MKFRPETIEIIQAEEKGIYRQTCHS